MPVSVIIPNWNAGSLLCDAVQSVSGDGAVGEIIVVDNASTDDSIARLEALDLPSLVIVRNKCNVGASKARHIAMGMARYEFAAFLDADDLVSPHALGNALQNLVAGNLDICILHMFRLLPDGQIQQILPSLDETITGEEAFLRTIGPWRIHPMGVMRRAIYDRAVQSFAFHGHSDDELLTRHLFLAARRVGGVKDRYLYRITPKVPTMQMTIGQVRTGLAVLNLALMGDITVPPQQLQDARNLQARSVFNLFRRNLRTRLHGAAVTELAQAVLRCPVPWRPADWLYLIATLSSAQAARFGNRSTITKA